MNTVQSSEAPNTPTVPRDYNFAADILKRNLDAGRGDKIAFIDHRGKYSYADLAERVERFGHALRTLTFFLPGASVWHELLISADDQILRDTWVTPRHRIVDELQAP